SDEAVAEHTLSLALGALKSLCHLDDAVRVRRTWPKREARDRLRHLGDQPVGIVGYGRLGQAAAKLFSAFGCEVTALTRTPPPTQSGVRFETELSRLFEHCSLVSLHVPLTGETKGLVNAHLLERLGPDGVLVNTSRGAVVDQD